MKQMTPILGILDDCDRPEARMLVVVWGNPASPMVEYLNPLIRPRGFKGRYNSFPSRFTRLTDFGVSACFEPDGRLRVKLSLYLSCATYPNGDPRYWQGHAMKVIEFRPTLATPVLKAVRALQALETTAHCAELA